MHVEEVGNELGIARMRQRGAHNSRSAVEQGRHRVEEVGHAVATALEALTGGLVVTPGMADLDRTPRAESQRARVPSGSASGAQVTTF